MRAFLITVGLLLVFIFGAIIVADRCRYVEVRQYVRDHPWESMFFPKSEKVSKSRECYTYELPLSNHEILMLSGVASGVVLFLLGCAMAKKC